MRLRAEKAVYGGDCLAHADTGETVMVPSTLPGEVVEASPLSRRRGVMEAQVVQVIEASADRIVPQCRHFGACGGCQYQHAAYPTQITLKASILQEMFSRAGLNSVPAVETYATEPWGYRNRVRFVLQRLETGWQLGYRRRGSHDLLAITECPIAVPRLWDVAQAVMALPADAMPKAARELELFCTADGNAVQMSLFVSTSVAPVDRTVALHFRAWCDAVQARVPQVTGGGLWADALSSGKHTASAREIEVVRWGSPWLEYAVGAHSYRVSRGAFFQVNRLLTDEMMRLVTEGRGGKIAYDLFAGVGLFSRVLAERFEQVIAVEVSEPAVSDLRAMLAGLSAGHHAVAKTALDFLRTQKQQPRREFAKPELVVMDPPRAGLGEEVCALLAGMAVPEMVYVSCDPSTLSRDLAALVKSGYTIKQVHLLDLFPQTFHMETVVVLRR